jgi:DNA (cytosine-5)-methyltransferase 1
MPPLTTIDLFCGAGGLTEGFRQAGFLCLFANDLDPEASRTFSVNHPRSELSTSSIEDLNPTEIRESLGLSPGELDCMVGGPPCQGFSINAPTRSLDDPRNALFRHYIAFVRDFRPKTIVLENVPGMLSLHQGYVVKRIVRELEEIGYAASYRILFAAHYGVPQERWRLVILASRLGEAPAHPVPTHAASARANFTGGRTLTLTAPKGSTLLAQVTVEQAIGDLPELEAGAGEEFCPYPRPPNSSYSELMRTGSKILYDHVAPRISHVNLNRLQHIKPGGSWRDIPPSLLPEGMKRARRSDHTRRYGRLLPDGLAGTVMTKMDPHWGPAFHYNQPRTLTVREAARLQSFPDRYLFAGARVSKYRQIGNAVPVLMAKAIALQVGSYLCASDGSATARAI